jgi:hypothetical protein
MPGTVFISYHHSDQSWKERLVTQLAALEGEGILRTWHDGLIKPGVDWLSEIEAAMAEARVALFLVSAPFLRSEFIQRREVPVLVERSKAAGVHVIPLIVDSCLWKKVGWLSALQARPRTDHALADLRRPQAEKVLVKLAEEIYEILQAPEPSGEPVVADHGVAEGGRAGTPDLAAGAAARTKRLKTTPPPRSWHWQLRQWKAWVYFAIVAGLAGILLLMFRPRPSPVPPVAAPQQEISGRVLPATGERISFLPGPQVEESVKDQIAADLASFAAYLTRLGYRPPGAEVNISFQPASPTLLFYYASGTHTIFIAPTFAKDTDIALHEYTHRMLLPMAELTTSNDLSDTYYAIESALAFYYPCSFHSRSDFGVLAARDNPQWKPLTLLNRGSFTKGFGDPSAREIWASAFWDLRELLHQERADRLLVLAWGQLGRADPRGSDPTRLVRLLTQDLEHGEASSEGAVRAIRAIFARRGLAP